MAGMTNKAITGIFMLVLVGAALITGAASARTSTAPRNTSSPTVTGTAREGNTLTAHNGGWANSPTSFTYQWQRCAPDGSGCTDIAGETKQTYTLASADVDHTLRVVVTATNADGSNSANSATTAAVSSKSAPINTVKPAISGTASVGQELSASTGTWTGGVTSYSYQWQKCTAAAVCTDVDGATARTYGVRLADVGSTLRVVVTAHNSSGSTASATSDQTGVVASAGGTTTVTTPGNKAPTLSFISLRRTGISAYARFRVCDDSTARLNVTERDSKPHVSSYTRHFLVSGKPCATYSRHWVIPARFRHGRYTVTLQARDRKGAASPARHRTLTHS
jgi:hypothetical protein